LEAAPPFDRLRAGGVSQDDISSSPDLSHEERDFPEISWLSIATPDRQSSISFGEEELFS